MWGLTSPVSTGLIFDGDDDDEHDDDDDDDGHGHNVDDDNDDDDDPIEKGLWFRPLVVVRISNWYDWATFLNPERNPWLECSFVFVPSKTLNLVILGQTERLNYFRI